MSEQIPAGWYPDPQDTTSDPRPQRWWDGKGWTAGTRPAPSDAPAGLAAEADAPPAADAVGAADAQGAPDAPGSADPQGVPEDSDAVGARTSGAEAGPEEDTRVLEGQVLQSGPAVRYPELPPPIGATAAGAAPGTRKAFRRPSRAVVVAASVAALLGLAVGSGVTYLAVDGDAPVRASHRYGRNFLFNGENGPRGGMPGQNGQGNQNGQGQNGQGNQNAPGQNGQGGSGGGKGGSGGGNGSNDGASAGAAADLVNRITLPVPSGWEGGTTTGGYAVLSIGSYTCAGTEADTCSLGGAVTSRIEGTDAQAAAKADIAQAAKESYGDSPSHEELKSEAVKVAGRDGYLVRWKVKAAKGNDGYVETVVFPTADGKALTALHLGFDVDPKAPDLALMDTIVKGVAQYTGKDLPGGTGNGTTT